MTRHGLLLTAVATVTVPGLLAVLGVLGHEHVTAEASSAASVALDGAPLSSPSPVASVTVPAGAHGDVAGAQAVPASPGAALSSVTTGQRALGMRLLGLAANASLATSYQGAELLSQSGVSGSVTMVAQVWHKSWGRTLVEASDGTAPTSAPAAQPAARRARVTVATSDPAISSPEGVFGVTKGLVALLGKHYIAVYWGSGSVVGRQASVVELYRLNGTLAARYWLDSRTMVPLRRELFGTSGSVISEDSFVRVRFGRFTAPRLTVKGRGLATSPQGQPAWQAAPSPAKFVAALGRQGWQLPSASPGGLPLYAAASTQTPSGEIVELEYTDGLYVVSLFMQRGTLVPDMPSWQPVRLDGQQAYVSGHSVTWAAAGFVYTVIADTPPQTVTQIVKTMTGGSPGVLARLGRGFVRLARVVNPFR